LTITKPLRATTIIFTGVTIDTESQMLLQVETPSIIRGAMLSVLVRDR
jgi:hypothetical protein